MDIDFKEQKGLVKIDNSIESQWIEIKCKNKRAIVLITTSYQTSSKNADKHAWLHKFDSITGDFNINLLKLTTVENLFGWIQQETILL